MYAGKKLKQLRLSLEMSQEEIAQKLEVSQSYYSSVERGKKKISASMLKKIQKLWRVNLYYFEGDADSAIIENVKGINEGGNEGLYGSKDRNNMVLKPARSFWDLEKNKAKLSHTVLGYMQRILIEIQREEPEDLALLDSERFVSMYLQDVQSAYSELFSGYELDKMAANAKSDYKSFKRYFNEKMKRIQIYSKQIQELKVSLSSFIQALKENDPTIYDDYDFE